MNNMCCVQWMFAIAMYEILNKGDDPYGGPSQTDAEIVCALVFVFGLCLFVCRLQRKCHAVI